eukprot:m.426291 g.426291  ORF g.426291 m.426291 type:complete len:193 (-) comp56688_c0_seq1:224-802(-)
MMSEDLRCMIADSFFAAKATFFAASAWWAASRFARSLSMWMRASSSLERSRCAHVLNLAQGSLFHALCMRPLLLRPQPCSISIALSLLARGQGSGRGFAIIRIALPSFCLAIFDDILPLSVEHILPGSSAEGLELFAPPEGIVHKLELELVCAQFCLVGLDPGRLAGNLGFQRSGLRLTSLNTLGCFEGRDV